MTKMIMSGFQRKILWLYRLLPMPWRSKVFNLYGKLVQRLLNYYLATAIVSVSNRQPAETAQSDPQLPQNNGRRVLILAPTFFDFAGNNMFYGGAERYLVELTRLVRNLGYEPEVYQPANSAWVRYYADIRVTGIDCGGDLHLFNERFHRLIPVGVLTIYLAFYLAAPRCHSRSIGISHGIYWDAPSFQTPLVQQQKLEDLIVALSNLEQLVSVDTNTINWVRSIQFNLARKCTYIPNFVDLKQFQPIKQAAIEQQEQRLVILYPRRLYEPRGFWLIAEIVPKLIEKYPYLEFHFVGKANPAEEEKVQELMDRYPSHICWYALAPERMHKAYQQANITIIPTLHSEGTSLSCLEALASGNTVVATNVGGLPDLILPGYNGLLIEPTATSLHQALEQLIQNEDLRLRLARQGSQVAQIFSLERWQTQWQQILSAYLSQPVPSPLNHKVQVAVFPIVPALLWAPLKQRSHHLALELASQGIETFWVNPNGRQTSSQNHLHIVAADDDLYLKEPILFISSPEQFDHIHTFEEFGRSFLIYDVPDYITFDQEPDIGSGSLATVPTTNNHLNLLERADLVLASSKAVEEKVKLHHPDVLFIPNGVDLEHFTKDRIFPTNELTHLRRPRIGFYSEINQALDYDLLLYVIQQRPQYQFIFIGPVSSPEQFQRVCAHSNTHYLGVKSYEQIPGYIIGFDVGILPFDLNLFIDNTHRLRALEYLAMGKPVVTTRLLGLTDWPGTLQACSAQEFTKALDVALESRSSMARDLEISAFVATSSWSEVVKPLLQVIKNLY
jgi:glycosyltransferase involved in cell wall biosynthesis